METLAGFANSFVSGELSEDVEERPELQQHRTGSALALNFVGLVAGPDASRGGFAYRGAPKHQDRARRLFAWKRADGEGLVLEIGHLYARVWTASGAPVAEGWAEFEQPFTEAQLAGLRLRQVGDIAYVTHRDGVFPRQINRASDTSWSVSFVQFYPPPWQPENVDEGKTLTLEEVSSGVWSCVANFSLFTAGHVGSQILIGPPGGFPGYGSWAPDTDVSVGVVWMSNGRAYSCESVTGTKSGSTAPNHDRGEVSDGKAVWKFRHDGRGVVEVTAVTSATEATLYVPKDIPIRTEGETTSNWSLAAFSDAAGWPTSWPAIAQERLLMAATPSAPSLIQASRSFGFSPAFVDFKPGLGTGLVLDDDAAVTGAGTERPRIVWMLDTMGGVLVGATDGEYLAGGGAPGEPFGPGAFTTRRISGHGAADVEPALVDGPPLIVLHVDRTGTTLRETLVDGDQAQAGRDLSILAQHICGKRILAMAWTKPDNILWARLGDDSLAAFTFHHEHGVMGWRRQEIAGGWKVEDLCASPDATGRTRLHVAAYRTKGGATQRGHLVLHPRPNYALNEAGMFLDAAEEYSGSATTTLSGLDHLAGETVAVVGDGAYVGDFTVSGGGTVSLSEAVSHAWVGLIQSRTWCSLPLDPEATGDMLGRLARPTQGLVVLKCVEAKVWTAPAGDATPHPRAERVAPRQPDDATPVARKVQAKVTLQNGADRDNRIWIQAANPFDIIIKAIRPVISTGRS